MTATTTNYAIDPEDGWVEIADSTDVLIISPNVNNKYFISAGTSSPPAGTTSATGTATVTSNAANNNTVTIGGQVYTFKTSLTAPTTANEVLIGVDADASAANLNAAINKAAGGGTTYGSNTVANAYVTSTVATNVVTLTSRIPGPDGNAITLTESGNLTVSGATLTGGAFAIQGIEVRCSEPFIIDQTISGKVYARCPNYVQGGFILSVVAFT